MTAASEPLDPSSKVIAIGDSIAQGLKNTPGLTTQGASVAAVTQEVHSLSADQVKDREIILSSGLSNSYLSSDVKQQLAGIAANIQFLESEGAHVTLLGVSNEKAGLNQYNAQLADIAKQTGAVFAPLPATGPDQIHPQSYQAVAASVMDANKKARGQG
jgi:hypothetical protein